MRKLMSKIKRCFRTKKGKIVGILSIVLILSIIGGGYYYQQLTGGVNTPGNTPKDPEPEPEPPKLQILDLDSKARPFAVMINNIGVARPLQSGLQDAFLIYEIIVEGGLTRLMALFHETETARIGGVRSARHYFIDYALENDAIYVFHGQSPQAAADFRRMNPDRIVVDGSRTGWRDNSLRVSSEHRLFTSMERLQKGMGNRRAERRGDFLLNYSVDPLYLCEMEGAKEATSISIRYPTMGASYTYDEENKVYKRFVNNNPHNDFVTKEQYTFKNIITYQVRNVAIGKGRQNLNNVGNGEGWFITNGCAVPITWAKTSRAGKTVYRLKNGEELIVNDGNTFIQIQPVGQNLVIG